MTNIRAVLQTAISTMAIGLFLVVHSHASSPERMEVAPEISPLGSLNVYQGFLEPRAEVQMVTHKGLIKEIVLRCSVRGGPDTPGIMIYSQVEQLFCSSQNRCYADVELAASETCGWHY